MKSFSTPLHQKGMTLVEMMVALTIGLLVTIAVGAVYLVATQGFKTNDDQSRNFEASRTVVDILSRNIRMAGAPKFTPWDINGSLSNPLPGGVSPLTGVEGGAAPDSLAIRYWSDEAYNPATLTGADCLGQAVGVGMVTNTFSISAAGQLVCQGSGGANTLPLVQQVVDLQFTYGLASDAQPGAVTKFVNATDVAGNWQRVRSVEVCFEVASFEPNTISGRTPGLNCRGQAFPADNRLHRLYRTTVNLRNGTTGNLFAAGVAP